jgi:hypothetical protein
LLKQEPTDYAGGGIIKKAAKALMSRAEQEANFAKFIAESKAPMRLYHGTIATEGGKREEAIRQMKPSKEGAFGSGVYLTPNSEYASTYTGIPARSQLERDMQTGSDYAKEHAAKLFARINRGEVKPHEVGGNMLPVFAQLKNPLILGQDQKTFDKATDALIKLGVEQGKAENMIERMWEDKGNIGKQIQSRAQAQGYDGLMVYQDGELSEIVSYNPSAIKSAIGNEGTYDITNPDMNKAGGGAVRKALKAVLPKGQQAILPAAESAANLERFLSKSQTANPVFHVAKTDVKQFSPQHRTELSSMGHHFGTSDQANFRSGQYDFNSQSPNIGKYHLSIQNPLEVSHMASFAPDWLADTMMDLNLLKPEKYDALVGKHDYNPLKIGDDLVKILKKNGYDGLKYPNEREGEGFSYVPFDATQIKSAIGNRGTYDITDPDINMAGGGLLKKAAKGLLPKGQQAVLPAAESAVNLERFLADSAVKDRAYHGTQADFYEFKSGPRNRLVKGMWFTSNPESANFWAGNTEGSNVMPVHLSLKNPAGREEYDSMLNSLPDDKKRTSSQRASQLKKLGHDGLIVNEGTDNETYIAFNPNQIKSAIGNRGTYDINEADINKAKGGQVTNDAMWIALQNKQLRKKHGN